MQNKLKAWCAAILLLTGIQVKAQQNIQFSQYAFNGLSVNPAYAGYKGDLYLNAFYRHQWAGFPGAPQTGGISLDGLTSAAGERVGLGVQMMFDKTGPQEALSLYGSYAYRIPLDNEDTRRLCFGIGAGVTQYSIDGTALRYVDNNDDAIPVGKVSRWIPDARFGIYYYTPSLYIGVSVMDLLSLYTDGSRFAWKGNTYETIRKTQHTYLTAGTVITLSENLKLKPTMMWKEDFKGPSSVDLNAFLLISEKLWVGGSYRTSMKLWNKSNLDTRLQQVNAASVILEYFAADRYRFGYSYDLNVNRMANYQAGSHEISIGVLFPSKRYNVSSPRYF
ncbi:PorP/SprF family type IX secretion system membrane protein [Chitinophaga qingshengii]|uniref:Type IX secretion system membrane protein PorP/SprF n=1 Tax=Chitinophaga qingshengii TaxID=1569794 RepID=A0ABR7TJ81_9BACT|nr:type IX secretion system membrane protein PorP/SprF [Chitinophaga qingshengii]MBC9929109.1 type IX secretion system membrane protein PorP/SprF [Chitinophaga qingshengii]